MSGATPSMDKQDLEPHQVVVRNYLRYSETMPRIAGYAAIFRSTNEDGPAGSLVANAVNHRGQVLTLSIPFYLDGEPFAGDAATLPRFVLHKLGPTVWEISPSILHSLLHSFVTIVGAPEPAPWELP